MDNDGLGERRRGPVGQQQRRQLSDGYASGEFPVSRGRPRKFDPTIPAHIDQRRVPIGAYWDRRNHCWYTLLHGTNKLKRRRLGGTNTTLAELHVMLSDLRESDIARGSFAWLHAQFSAKDCDAWNKLSRATQRDYDGCQRVLARTKTTTGVTYADLLVDRTTKVHLQLLVDAIGKTTPAQANHVRRYLGRLYTWGMARGKCRDRPNPAHGLDGPVERGLAKMPTPQAMVAAITLARLGGALQSRAEGACPPYLWIMIVFAYRLRLRGIEVLTLTDAHATAEGIRTNRRKGSRDNIVRWSPQLREAWDCAQAYRTATWERRRHPLPLHAHQRHVLVNAQGEPIKKSALDSTWQRFMALAIKGGVLSEEERFTLHGLKHRGITDSKNKKDGGHVDDRMAHRYDHDLPLVDQAGTK